MIGAPNPAGATTVILTPEDLAAAEAAVAEMRSWADGEYKRRHPSDIRSWQERVEDAWEAHFSGGLSLDLAVCPHCGIVPDLNECRGYCCKLGRWLRDSALDEEVDECYYRPIERAAARFSRAIANDDTAEADKAAAELIKATGTTNLDDAFVEANLWPTPSCGCMYCFETPTRVWHAPNFCTAVDGSARDFQAWRESGEVGPPPEHREVASEPRILSERTNQVTKEQLKHHKVEHERQLEVLYGADVVTTAREAQRAYEAEEERLRAGANPSGGSRSVNATATEPGDHDGHPAPSGLTSRPCHTRLGG